MSDIIDAFNSIGKKINKAFGETETETQEGIVSEKLPELKLEMPNEEIIKLTDKWEKSWNESTEKSEWIQKCDDNEKYWLGKHYEQIKADKSRAMIDNVIFEALETYLPQVTRRNPEPMVTLDNDEEQTPENLSFASEMQKELGEIADETKLRLKLKRVARHWAIYLLGAAKMGWDLDKDIPTLKATRARKLILDPTSTIDEDGYTGEFIGEYRKIQASKLLAILKNNDGESDAEKVINELTKGNNGSEITFKEWWTDSFMCWRLGDHVLLKKRNAHWNYDSEEPAPADATTGETPIDPNTGQPQTVPKKGINHFSSPKKPYIFLSVFNLGKQPIDDTSLIGQNLAGQDKVNKRNKQIDKNTDSMNGGMVVSLERSGLTQDQAKGVTEALRKGGTVTIPTGAPREAVDRFSATGLPADVYNDLVDTRNRMKDIFGTRGSSAAGIESEKTVRGKMINRSLDTDRIGGGLSEYLEQFADDVYNWCIQLLLVYSDKYTGKQVPKLHVSVKEGSLLPKDVASIASQAIDLASVGKMSLIDLYKRLDFPNAEEMAANVWLEANAPEILFSNDQRVQQVIQSRQQPDTPPSKSISYKDLTPDAKAQLLKQAGIEADPEAIAAHDELNEQKEDLKLEKSKIIPQPNLNN